MIQEFSGLANLEIVIVLGVILSNEPFGREGAFIHSYVHVSMHIIFYYK